MKIISVVIPTYNMEKYLAKCLDSFQLSSYQNEIELLIVNDGSKDQSLNIAYQYQQKYPDLVRVIDKENGGHGSTINRGLKEARGKYFKVVDADDWVDAYAFRSLVTQLQDIDVDVVVNDFVYTNEERMVKKVEYKLPVQQKANLWKHIGKNRLSMHSVTYRTDLLLKIGLMLQENTFYVDNEYMFFPLNYVQSVYYIHQVLYYYRVGRTGQSMTVQSLVKNQEQHKKVILRIAKSFKIDRHPQQRYHYQRRLIHDLLAKQFIIYLYSMGLGAIKALRVLLGIMKHSNRFYEDWFSPSLLFGRVFLRITARPWQKLEQIFFLYRRKNTGGIRMKLGVPELKS